MFCQKCGTVLSDAATACLSCNTSIGAFGASPASSAAAATIQSAARDALATLKKLAGNPVGGLAPAYEALGEARALRAGVAFGVVSLACFLLGGYLMLPPFLKEDLFSFLGFGGVMKCLLFGLVPFLCTAAGMLALRLSCGGKGALGGDCFTAGAALLPASASMLLGGLVGIANFEVIGILAVFAGCIGTLMLVAGTTRITKLSERAGAFGVPLVILASAWLAKVISTSVLTGGGPSDGPYGYPF